MLAACSPDADIAAADAPLQVEEVSMVTDPAPPGPQVDPAELDLSQIALAMRIPSTFRAYEDGATLQINLISPRLGVEIAETFPLVITRDVESPFLTSELKDGFSIWTFGTRPEDSVRLAALSAQLARPCVSDFGRWPLSDLRVGDRFSQTAMAPKRSFVLSYPCDE
jgi:hypothetical protein